MIQRDTRPVLPVGIILGGEGRPDGLNAYNSPRRCTPRYAQEQPFNYTQRDTRVNLHTLASRAMLIAAHSYSSLTDTAIAGRQLLDQKALLSDVCPNPDADRDSISWGHKVMADKDSETKQQHSLCTWFQTYDKVVI